MSIYLILVAVILAAGVLLGGRRKGRSEFIVVACIALFCVYGLRDAFTVGNDSTTSYVRQFNTLGAAAWSELPGMFEEYNAGYDWLNKVIYELTGGNYQIFIIIISAFVTIVFGSFLMRYSTSPLQSITYYLGLLLYTFMFSALKQSIAMAFVLLAFNGMMEDKPLKFTLLVLIGGLFHFPALVFLPAYWLSKRRMDISYLVLLGAILFLVFIFREWILRFMLGFYDDNPSEAIAEGVRFLRTKVLIMIAILIAAFVIRPPKNEDRLYTALLQLLCVAIVFQTFCGYNNIFERLADYYFQFAVVLIPMVFDKPQWEVQGRHRIIYAARNFGPYIFGAYGLWRFVTTAMNDPTFNNHTFFFQ